MVYTYRSCSKALPQVKNQDDPNKGTIYEKTFQVLEPEIKKLKDFMFFSQQSVKLFSDHVKSIAAEINDSKKNPKTTSEVYIEHLVALLDMFVVLDAVKNMKACLNNDFAFYKRAFQFLRKSMASDDQTAENSDLQKFLAVQNSIAFELRGEIQKTSGYQEVLGLFVNQCARYLETNLYCTHLEKHRLLRVLPYGLYLMDGDKDINLFRNKNVNIQRFFKIFKKYPIVPLYGDMQISLEQTIKRCPHWDEGSKLYGGPTPEKTLQTEYELLYDLDLARAQHDNYMAKFSNLVNQIHIAQRIKGGSDFSASVCKSCSDTVLEGLQLLNEWSGRVLRQSAWKYSRPNTETKTEGETVEYERVVKLNYSSEDRFALVEYIAFIKGLAGVMVKYDSLLTPLIMKSIHIDVQEFIQISLREMISFASKKKKVVREEMLQLRALAADWHNGVEPDDPAIFGKKVPKSAKNVRPEIPNRHVGPSPTQLDLIRTITYAFLSHKLSPNKKGPYSDKDFKGGAQIKTLEDFLERSFFYKHLMNFSRVILETTDLADLWYREFYLELSNRLQFPIEMSLPWILTDHILESKNSAMMEFVLYPLDLYNDAANRALRSLHQRFLYDEIEAEVNLCFDQLVFKISEQIYTYYKIQASSILLDKLYKSKLESMHPGRFNPPKSRYEVLLKQRHFELLGRSIDLSFLISQRINTKVRQNFDFVIARFEASDITSITELEIATQNIRLTHHLLSRHFELDPIEECWNEINESASLVSFHGRVALHVIFELVYDFFPNFNFNSVTQRFIKAPKKTSSEEVPRESPPKPKIPFQFGNKALTGAYNAIFQLYQSFFGLPHLLSLLRLVGRTNLPLVVGECLENLKLKIQNVLVPYIRVLFSGMPQSSKLRAYDYQTIGNYSFFTDRLTDLRAYQELPKALQQFKEFGNTIAFMNFMEQGLAILDMETFIQAAPFLGITPDTLNEAQQESPLYTTTSNLCNYLNSSPLTKSTEILPDLTNLVLKADKIYRPSALPLSLFKSALSVVAKMVSLESSWAGTPPDNGVVAVDSTTEFYRLWSALQFVFCMPPPQGSPNNQEVFGDGFAWGGMTLVYFLKQHHRFQVFDFSYHILNVQEAIPQPKPADTPAGAAAPKPGVGLDPMRQLFEFLPQVSQMKDLNQDILNTLFVTYPIHLTEILILAPPSEEYGTEFITSGSTSTSGAVTTLLSSSDSTPASLGNSFNITPPPPVSTDEDNVIPPPMDDNPPPYSSTEEEDNETFDDAAASAPPPPIPTTSHEPEFTENYPTTTSTAEDTTFDTPEELPPPLPRDTDKDEQQKQPPPPVARDDAPPPVPRDEISSTPHLPPPTLRGNEMDTPPSTVVQQPVTRNTGVTPSRGPPTRQPGGPPPSRVPSALPRDSDGAPPPLPRGGGGGGGGVSIPTPTPAPNLRGPGPIRTPPGRPGGPGPAPGGRPTSRYGQEPVGGGGVPSGPAPTRPTALGPRPGGPGPGVGGAPRPGGRPTSRYGQEPVGGGGAPAPVPRDAPAPVPRDPLAPTPLPRDVSAPTRPPPGRLTGRPPPRAGAPPPLPRDGS